MKDKPLHLSPKDKAKEIYEMFHPHAFHPSKLFNTKDAGGHTLKICLKHVDAIINQDYWFPSLESCSNFTSYWYEVQEELMKMYH